MMHQPIDHDDSAERLKKRLHQVCWYFNREFEMDPIAIALTLHLAGVEVLEGAHLSELQDLADEMTLGEWLGEDED